MKVSNLKGGAILAAAAAAMSLGVAAAQADTPAWCGPKKATIAFLDGFGGNSWRRRDHHIRAGRGAEVPEHHQI